MKAEHQLTSEETPTKVIALKITKLMGSVKLPEDFDYKKELTSALIKSHK